MVTAPRKSDASLLEKVAQGDPEAFAALVGPHLRPLLAFAVRVAPDAASGEDALQDVLGQAYRTLQRKSAPELEQLVIRPWLFRSLINRIRRTARPRAEIASGLSIERGAQASVEDAVGQRALLRTVDSELRKLPRDWRAAILLRHHAGYGTEEIAALLDRPSGTVKAWIHRGLRRVREAMTTQLPEGGAP